MNRWALVLLLCGCATQRIPHVPGDPPPAVDDGAAERAYQDTLDRWTRSQSVYDNLDTKLFVRATYQSAPFAEARVRREGVFKAWPEPMLQEKLHAEQQRLEGVTEFFLAVHANDYRFEDFDKANSLWRMVLKVGGQEIAPVEVKRLGRTNTEMRSTYSYMESFWVGYRVQFPKQALTPGQGFELMLASALGKVDLPFTAE